MLADIPAIVSTDPIEIARGIRLAVGAGEQAKQKYGPLAEARKQLQETIEMETAFNQIAQTPDGVKRLNEELLNLDRICEGNVSDFGPISPFRLHRSGNKYPWFIAVESPPIRIENFNRVQLRFQVSNFAVNSIYRAKLRRSVLLINADPYENVRAHIAHETTFEVYCRADKTLIWRDDKQKLWSILTVAEEGLKLLYERTDDAKNSRPFKHWTS